MFQQKLEITFNCGLYFCLCASLRIWGRGGGRGRSDTPNILKCHSWALFQLVCYINIPPYISMGSQGISKLCLVFTIYHCFQFLHIFSPSTALPRHTCTSLILWGGVLQVRSNIWLHDIFFSCGVSPMHACAHP